jgi:hypothetical protein
MPNKRVQPTLGNPRAPDARSWATDMISRVRHTIAAAATLFGLVACTSPSDDGGLPAISVTVGPNGTPCLVADLEMPCTEVAAYIRDVAKIERDRRVVVTGDPSKTDHRHFVSVIKGIEATGYTFVIATFYIDTPPR